jgi:hypothetical protein
MNALKEMHLTIESKINGKRIGDEQELHDPFFHTRTTYELSIWERLKTLWTGRIVFEVKVRGDDIAHRQWFRTDPLPRGGDGGPVGLR